MGIAPHEQWSGQTAFVPATVAGAARLGGIRGFSFVAGVPLRPATAITAAALSARVRPPPWANACERPPGARNRP
jgi:hypothetical protein